MVKGVLSGADSSRGLRESGDGIQKSQNVYDAILGKSKRSRMDR
jgi:hypothetical protein